MPDGDPVIYDGIQRIMLLLDANAGASGDGTWVSVGQFSREATVDIKLASGWDGTWTIYGSNDLSPTATGGAVIQSGSGSNSMVNLGQQTPLNVRVGWTGRTAGNITATFCGRRGAR